MRRGLATLLALCVLPAGATALSLDYEVFVGAGAGESVNPSQAFTLAKGLPPWIPAPTLQSNSIDREAAATFRLGLKGGLLPGMRYEINGLLSGLNSTALPLRDSLAQPATGRSLVLQRRFGGGETERYRVELDQAYVSYNWGRLNARVGRQPINLSTNFY